MDSDTEKQQLRSFGLIVGSIFAVMSLWPAVWQGNHIRLWALVLAAVLVILAVVSPRSLRRIYWLWMTSGHVLGWINTKIILSIIFYGLFTPVRIAMYALGKELIHRKFEPDVDTYRVVRQPRSGVHMLRQF